MKTTNQIEIEVLANKHGEQTQVRWYQFDVFDTHYSSLSNRKSEEDGACLTRLTHLTSNRTGCTWRVRSHPHACPLMLLDTPVSVGVKRVKHVKYPPHLCDSSFTVGVKPGVNLTPTTVNGVAR